jgi:hypothetical protein
MLQKYAGKIRYRRNLSGKVEAYDPDSGKILAVESSPDEWVPATVVTGIPTVYSEKIGDLILQGIEEGKTLSKVLKQEGMPQLTTVLRWVEANPVFADRLRLARVAYAEALHDRIVDKAEGLLESPASKSELESMKEGFAVLKWSAEKQAPEKYGSRKVDGAQGGIVIQISTGIDRSTVVEVQGERITEGGGEDLERGRNVVRGSGEAVSEGGETEAEFRES